MDKFILHEPVLLREVLSVLDLKPGDTVLDGTLGSGGHAQAILEKIGPSGLLIGIDQDEEALERAKKRLSAYQSQVIFCRANFRNLDQALASVKISAVDAVLLDIGVSKEQLSEPKRGFSFRLDGPLDMRMDLENAATAFDLVQTLSEKELADIFYHYGEERHSRQIARWIVRRREKVPIRTTRELAELIEEKVPRPVRYGRIHPATRIFQALRIAVNRELDALKEGLQKAIVALKPGGRLAVISFHSLEDRIVKHTFLAAAREKKVEILTKKPMIPLSDETARNPESRSAKLRAVEKNTAGLA